MWTKVKCTDVCGVGLALFVMAGCSSSSDMPRDSANAGAVASNGAIELFGVGWAGTVEGLAGDMLMVQACVNATCRAQNVPVAGLADVTRWEPQRPAEAPAGAPATSEWQLPGVGTCKTFYQWQEQVGISSCAMIQAEGDPQVHVQAFLDLSLQASVLATGDMATIVVSDSETGAVLGEKATTVTAGAPYYVNFSF